MIVEERIYTLQSQYVETFLQIYEAEGLPIQLKTLPRLVGYFKTEIGNINQVVHLCGYASLQERDQKRAELRAQPGWSEYTKKVKPFFVNQETRILTPLPWSPVK